MKKFKISKTHYRLFFGILILFLLFLILANWNFGKDKEITWGATFSKKQAEELGMDWQWVYWHVINELPVKSIRLPIYWDDVETSPGKYDFSDYIWMINEANKLDIEIIPVLGRRVPRWPECHTPIFYTKLPESKVQEKIFNLLTEEVNFFQNYSNIKKWQIDNEPFLDVFGECPHSDQNLLKQEISLVKSLNDRPILITESGELSTWVKGAKLGDILGISMYRQTWNKNWGYFRYPIWPIYYYLKAQIIKLTTGVKQIINTELQVEPWATSNNLKLMDLNDQFYTMDLDQVKENVSFAKKTGINEIYLWGVEWWWWLGETHGIWDMWEYGKQLN